MLKNFMAHPKIIERKNSEQKGGGKFMEVRPPCSLWYAINIGVGYTPLKKLCCYLNMPEPMSSER